MIRELSELEARLGKGGKRASVALAGAHDPAALAALMQAVERGYAHGLLLGDREKILEELDRQGLAAHDCEIIPVDGGEQEAADRAVRMVSGGEADIPMKGLMQTSSFMRALLNKEWGLLPPDALLSQATIFEQNVNNPGRETRLMLLTDCAINIAPDLEAKKKILANGVELARGLGFEAPRAAVVTPLEVVNPKIQSTVDACELQAWAAEGLPGCEVEGPLALDNAVCGEAARHKGVSGPVAGHADILLLPDLGAGNILFKSLVFFARANCCAALCGTSSPVVMTSRTDTPTNKYYSVLLAILRSQHIKEEKYAETKSASA